MQTFVKVLESDSLFVCSNMMVQSEWAEILFQASIDILIEKPLVQVMRILQRLTKIGQCCLCVNSILQNAKQIHCLANNNAQHTCSGLISYLRIIYSNSVNNYFLQLLQCFHEKQKKKTTNARSYQNLHCLQCVIPLILSRIMLILENLVVIYMKTCWLSGLAGWRK